MEIYDFGAGFPAIDDGNDYFESRLRTECAFRGMSYILIDRPNLESITGRCRDGAFRLKFYLDMASETFTPNDAYLNLNYLLKKSDTKIVDDPDDVKISADKSLTHCNLMARGVPVPYTVITKGAECLRPLTDQERLGLGHFFVVKPALGYGRRGVKFTDYDNMQKAVNESLQAKMGDTLLIQEFIEPAHIGGRKGWFRIFYIFGEIIPCWWDPEKSTYHEVLMHEIYEYKLLPLIEITRKIAHITRVDWFSTEIAINKKNNEFIAVDYVNDQCWVNPKSKSPDGIPDDILSRMAYRIVEKAHYHIRRLPLKNRSISVNGGM
ncbi:MAG: hypothetical protein JW994_08210 [Candidatus Omnitrophica bacterium]|nr:hypothetical protein [Candidatus Omnitrophota bacterium]